MTMNEPHATATCVAAPLTSAPAIVATAGEALIDLVAQTAIEAGVTLGAHPGGSVYNLTRALALLNVSVAYLNGFSADPFGQLLRRQLRADGARCREENLPQPTALAIVSPDAQGQPQYSFHREGVADRALGAANLIEATVQLPTLRLVVSGGLALDHADRNIYLPWLRNCRARGLTLALDANLRPRLASDLAAYRRNVAEALALADIIKVSDEDLQALTGADPLDPLPAAKALLLGGRAQWLALTVGARGAWLLHRQAGHEGQSDQYILWQGRDIAPPRMVDSVGAGDCFFAGLLAAWLSTAAPGAAAAPYLLKQAIACASLCLAQRGCVPARPQELARRLANNSIRVSSAL